ncbi:ABC transporter substrate-binding protein [Acidisoma silvae]|uniref:ABC transporter substrate-binding protein n=1 Tax=Acidisoma silvae TaxID=2802396 RepID=A0A963YXJ3_9PROT|nr:ABC transporter substrate-binding protein [Acidisoma silvae]MCB8878135.1 ABC transporter substrate-binding protein [Acidisoma silvae]
MTYFNGFSRPMALSRRRLLQSSALGLAATTLASVGLSPIARADDTPKRGGILTMARIADVVSFEPVVPSDNMSIWAKLLIFQLLVRTNPSGDGVVPDLATSWDISDDKRTYTFHLNPKATFSDGTPVTSEDVAFSFGRTVYDKDSPWGSLFPKLTMETPDVHTIIFKLQQDWAPFLAAASLHGAAIVPKAYFNKVGVNVFADKPIGSGPFLLTEWKKGDSVTFGRNPHFWDPNRPYLDGVVLSIVADDNVRMLKAQSGEIDIGTQVPFNQVDKLKHASGLDIQIVPYTRIDWIQFNEKLPVFQDVKIRQAINYAVDKEAIIKAVLFGYGEVPTTFLPKMFMADVTDKPYPYDLAKAKELMAASSMPTGFTVKCLINSGDTIFAQVAQIVQQMLLPLGIKISIQPEEGNTVFAQTSAGQYEMAQGYMTSDIFDPCELVAFAGAGDEGSDSVWTFYNNPKVDQLATAALGELDEAKRRGIYLDMQRQVFADAPYLWLYWTPAITAMRDNVHGFRVLPTGNYWLEDVWKS